MELGEEPSIYVWPKGHENGQDYPEDFWERVRRGLASEGIDYETT